MAEANRVLGTYLHLARASDLRMKPMVRDKLLVLAGVQAESMGLAEISALCRHKVLAHNARHLVRRWPTLEEALADERFLSYLKQLKRRYSEEKVEHMLETLGIELGRERELYANDLEYAAALLGTEPGTIGDILSGESPLQGVRELRWATATAVVPTAKRQSAATGAAHVRHLLIVWAPLAAGALLVALLVALSRAWAR
jgi:hypothetical protein